MGQKKFYGLRAGKKKQKNKKTQTRLKNKGCLKSCGEGIWWDEAC